MNNELNIRFNGDSYKLSISPKYVSIMRPSTGKLVMFPHESMRGLYDEGKQEWDYTALSFALIEFEKSAAGLDKPDE